MKVVLQRVKSAYVEVDSIKISEISQGLLIFWGIEEEDTDIDGDVLINKILNFRIFSDENLKMNKSIIELIEETTGLSKEEKLSIKEYAELILSMQQNFNGNLINLKSNVEFSKAIISIIKRIKEDPKHVKRNP